MTMPSTSNPQQQSQHFLLKWNNHRSNMVNVFESLFHEENLVDITLAVEGKFLKAHKIILSACSPYFQSLFITQIPNEKHPILIFHDLKFNHLKILLEFMYLGEISIDEKDLSDVLRVAESLSIRGLSSFDSDDEDSSSEQKMKVENGNNQSSQPPTTSTSSSSAANANQSQNFDNHFHGRPGSPDSCDSDSPAPSVTVTPAPVPPKQKSTKAKKDTAAAVPPRSEPTVVPTIIKRKRGRQPGTKMTSTSVASSLGSKSKIQSRHLDSSKPVAQVPRQGVRRRLPKKYNSQPPLIKRERLSNSSETLDPESSELVIDFQDYADSDSTNGPPLHPDLSNSEPLSEMSVRGLDLFRYASVEDGVYKCMECEKLRIPKTFKNKYSFQRHAFLYHEGNMRKVFPCPVCCREFSRPDKMKNHLRSIHQDGGSNGKGCMSPDGRNEDSGTF